jgi:hypothetical protein
MKLATKDAAPKDAAPRKGRATQDKDKDKDSAAQHAAANGGGDAPQPQPEPEPEPQPEPAPQQAVSNGAGHTSSSTSTVSPIDAYMRAEAPHVILALNSYATRLGQEGNYSDMNAYMDRATIVRELSGWRDPASSYPTLPASMVASAGR